MLSKKEGADQKKKKKVFAVRQQTNDEIWSTNDLFPLKFVIAGIVIGEGGGSPAPPPPRLYCKARLLIKQAA